MQYAFGFSQLRFAYDVVTEELQCFRMERPTVASDLKGRPKDHQYSSEIPFRLSSASPGKCHDILNYVIII